MSPDTGRANLAHTNAWALITARPSSVVSPSAMAVLERSSRRAEYTAHWTKTQIGTKASSIRLVGTCGTVTFLGTQRSPAAIWVSRSRTQVASIPPTSIVMAAQAMAVPTNS